MGWKKKLLAVLLAVLVAAAAATGVKWNTENFVLVDLHFYPKNQEVLDLRGENIRSSRFEKLSEKLPHTRILWDVPLSGGSVSCLSEDVTLTQLSREDVALFAYLENVKTVSAEGCQDYEALLELENRYPHLEVRYSVALGDERFDNRAEMITVRGVTGAEFSRLDNLKQLKRLICAGAETSAAVGLKEACLERNIDFSVLVGGELLDPDTVKAELVGVTYEDTFLLASLPNLKSVHIIDPQATPEQLLALEQKVTWEARVCGVLCSSEDTQLDLSKADALDREEIDAALSWFPKVETVFLGKCGIDNKTLAAWREEKREDYKLVWTVQLGKKLTARTDDKTFMPVREHVYYFNDEEAYNLRYCEEMVCIDIGHMSIHNIDFVEYMPDLTYLILAHTQLQYIEPIRHCKNLKFLELDWAPIRDLSPLVECTALEDLNLGNTFASFEPVKKMTWLKNLWVIDCSSGTAYKMSQALPNTKVVGSGSATVDSGWRDLPNYYDMRDALGMHYMSW